ncbi:mechanosensitive ion channel, partial [Faecalibaculum rodentium]
MRDFRWFTDFFNTGLGTAIKAVLLLVLAFIVAAIAKSLIVKLLSRTKLATLKGTGEGAENQGPKTIDLIGKLVQLVVFLLFVPGIFEILGMTQVSAPVLTLLNTVWGYVPNILFCVIILWIGFYVARLVRELLIPVLNKLEVNRLQKIAGIEVRDEGRLSNTIAYIVYVLILIPVIISALYVLDIKAISDPAIA